MSITTLSGAWQHKQISIVPRNKGDCENTKDRGRKSSKIHMELAFMDRQSFSMSAAQADCFFFFKLYIF